MPNLNLTKQSYQNTPLKNGVLSLKNYLKALGFKVWPHNLTMQKAG